MVKKLIQLDKETLKQLTAVAKAEDRSVNNMILYIIKQYLNK
jgi:fructose-1,6-bisphosphatase/sedoheptulose 1,7-bisphosphatase-like protein